MTKNILKDWFDCCRSDLERAAEQWCQATGSALNAAHRDADNTRVASKLYHAKRALERMHAFLPKRFVELLKLSMMERLGGTEVPFRTFALSNDVGLVDDDVVNESIEVSRIVAQVLFEVEWEIREAEQGLALRLGQRVVEQRISPFHPEALARAVLRLIKEMSLNAEERAACLHVASEATVVFGRAWSAIAVAWFGPADPTSGFVVRRSTSAVHRIPVDVSFVNEEYSDGRRSNALATVPTLKSTRPLDSRDRVFRDLILIIERILSDVRLTLELRRVLSGLQMMAMRFALASPDILYAPEHELWSMCRRLVDYALVHCLRDRIAHDDFILFADQQIQLMLSLDISSPSSLVPNLRAIEDFVRERPYQLIEIEKHTMQDLARKEDDRRKLIDATINQQRKRISSEIGQAEMPFRLRQFMLADWAEVLARTELSDGMNSGTFAEYWNAIRRMISLIRGPTELPGRCAADVADIQSLLDVFERGMASISVPSVEKHELAAVFLFPFVPRNEWLDSDLQSNSLAQRGDMPRSQQERVFWGGEPERNAATTASSAGLSSAMPARDAEYWVNRLCPGSVIEIFLLGNWLEARVASITDGGDFFVLQDELEDRTHPLTRRALLRLVREGLAGPI